MRTLQFWARNIQLRLVMLSYLPDWSDTIVFGRVGWSHQRHGQVMHAEKLSTSVMERMAHGLRCPVSVLLAEDPARVVGHEVQMDGWDDD